MKKLPDHEMLYITSAAIAVHSLYRYFSDAHYREDKDVLDVARGFAGYVKSIEGYLDWM